MSIESDTLKQLVSKVEKYDAELYEMIVCALQDYELKVKGITK